MLVPSQKPVKLLERDVTRQIRDFLRAHGWRPIRMQRTVVPGQFQSGEPGMADYQFVHYLAQIRAALALVIWTEMKSPTDRRRCTCHLRAIKGKKGKCTPCTQADWRRNEEAKGALFGPGYDFDVFQEWYWKHFAWLHDGRLPGQIEMFGGAV